MHILGSCSYDATFRRLCCDLELAEGSLCRVSRLGEFPQLERKRESERAEHVNPLIFEHAAR